MFLVQHVVSVCVFFFQDQSNKSDNLPRVEKNMFCCAQFTEDDGWYRARIIESSAEGDTSKVQVIYVDFGNHETLPVSRLRMLRKEHAELPMMSVLCALEGVTPLDGVRNIKDIKWHGRTEIRNFSLSGEIFFNMKRESSYLQVIM